MSDIVQSPNELVARGYALSSRPYIKSVHMENFMCHTNFKIDLIPRVNLICGSNGSGKSTILVALMVALGSRAKSTSRGDSLAHLVMKGKNKSYVHVKMHIPLEYVELYEKYGDEVTVSRSIDSKGAGKYELRNSDGHIVRGAGSKHIKSICEQFGIYPDNDLAMLSQENAKDFLVHVTAKNKYEKLHRALLQHMIGINQRMVQNAANHQQILINRMKLREQHYEGLEKVAEHVLENANLHLSKQQRLADINMVRDWRAFQDILEVKTTADQTFENAKREYEEIEQQESLEPMQNQVQNAIVELESEIAESDSRNSQISEELNAARELHHENIDLVARVEEDIEKFDEEYARFGKEISETERKAAEHSPERLEALRANLEREQANLRNKKDDIFQRKSDNDNLISEKKHELESQNQVLKPLWEEKAEKSARLRQIQADINELNSSNDTNNNRRQYGGRGNSNRDDFESHKKLRAAVAMHKTWSTSAPVGPLYSYIEVKDEGSEYAPALEKLWFTTLSSWWVTSAQDRDLLRRMAERISPTFNPTILVRQDDRFSIENELPKKSSQYVRMVDVLEISVQAILRILIDQNRIEKLVLTPKMEDAFAIADLHNVRDVLTVSQSRQGETNFHVISKTENRRDTNFIFPSNASLLKVGNEGRRRLLSRDLRDCQSQISAIQNQLAEEESRQRSIKEELSQLERIGRAISSEIDQINLQINENVAEISRIEADFSEQDFTVDIMSLRSARRQAKMNANGAKDTREELLEDLNESKAILDKLEASWNELRTSYRHNKIKLDDAQRTLRRLKRDELQRKQQLDLKEEKVEHARVQQEVANQDYDRALSRFETAHGNLKSREQMEASNEYFTKSERSLTIEIEKLTSEQSVVETTKEQVEIAERELEEARASKQAAISRRRDMEKSKNLIITGQEQRAENERRVWNEIKKNIKTHFQNILKLRNYTGEVVIDDSRHTLVASASPDARSAQGTQTLSGGEKSLTQIALLMSVWQSMDLGLVAMDEYDVFMDKMNRSVSLRCIGETAENAQLQCIIITPQDVDTSALEGIQHVVRRLNPAR